MLGKCVVDAAMERGHSVEASFMSSNDPDVVFNCIGRIPSKAKSPAEMIESNARWPHTLAATFPDSRIIHVSTDCVFSGRKHTFSGGYTTNDLPDPVDLYGRSKLCGESAERNVLNVRTSFIWFDHGLLPWLLEHEGPTVPGWLNALWTGSTAPAVARGLLDIAEDSCYETGVVHLSSRWKKSKYEVLAQLNRVLALGLEVSESVYPYVNRALEPTVELPGLDDPRVITELVDEYHRRYDSSGAVRSKQTVAS